VHALVYDGVFFFVFLLFPPVLWHHFFLFCFDADLSEWCVQLEMLLYDTAKDKMMVLARAVAERHESSKHETKFVQDAITQLLKARHVLKCSYVYGYYLEEVGYKKPIFEFMQVN